MPGASMIRLQLLAGGQGDRLRPLDCLLLAGRQLAQEVDRLVALEEEPPDEGMPGGRREVGVVAGAVGEGEAEVRLAVDPHAGQGDGPVREGEGLDGVLVLAQLLAGERRMIDGDLGAVLLGQEVVGNVVAVHRVLGFAGGHEDVLRSGDLVGDRVDLFLQLGKGLGEDALILDREVVETVHHASRSHRNNLHGMPPHTVFGQSSPEAVPRDPIVLYGWDGVVAGRVALRPGALLYQIVTTGPQYSGCGGSGRMRPQRKPAAQPPRWAALSIPFTEKPKMTLMTAHPTSCMRSDLAWGVSRSRCLSRKPMSAPSSPKMAPEAPTLRPDVTRALASEPAMPLTK